MKKQLLYALTALVLLPGSAVAVSDENVTKRRPDRPQEAQIQVISQESRSNVAQNHANRLKRRFDFYAKRLSQIITRFEARLEILEGDGKNITDAKAKLTLAKTKLEAAKLAGAEAVAAFEAIEPAKFNEQKDEAFAARDLAVAARKLFQEALVLLKDALKSLKLISSPAVPAASAAVQNAL